QQDVEVSITDIDRTTRQTNGKLTYFAMPVAERHRRLQGKFPPPKGDPGSTLDDYVLHVAATSDQKEAASEGATLMSDVTSRVDSFDDLGNIKLEGTFPSDVDLDVVVTRSFSNDTSSWLIGQLDKQTTCSTSGNEKPCRVLTRVYDSFGDVHVETNKSTG